MKKIVIVGVTSCLGSNLAIYLRKYYHVYGTYSTRHPRIDGVPCFKMTITPHAQVEKILQVFQPHAVIYCAAQTDYQKCENDPQTALHLHAQAPATLAGLLKQSGGRLIYLSTSKVFSGQLGSYREIDKPDPHSMYGQSKLRGEELLKIVENTFILRLGTVFGLGSIFARSTFSQILKSLWKQEELPLIYDEFRTFMGADELCKAIGICIDADINKVGIYHLGTSEKHSYHSFGVALANVFGLSTERIQKVKGENFTRTVDARWPRRGQDLTLNGNLFKQTFNHNFSTVDRSLRELQRQMHYGRQ